MLPPLAAAAVCSPWDDGAGSRFKCSLKENSLELSSVLILARIKWTSLLTIFLNRSSDVKLIRDDNLKLALVLLVQTKAPFLVVVVVVVKPPMGLLGDPGPAAALLLTAEVGGNGLLGKST